MNRIQEKFKSLDKTAFIGFITGGDPTLDKLSGLVMGMQDGGCDIVEIGIPYSDPLADGPVIQRANSRALSNKNHSVKNLIDEVTRIREKTQIPILFLVYINTILVYGKQRFINDCEKAGIDGLIIPDMPLEERDELMPLLINTDISLIPLVAPTTKDRLEKVLAGCSGFVYCVSSLGVTGRSSNFYDGVEEYLTDIKNKTDLPIAVGFGISSKQDIEMLSPYVDGVIVGSAIVDKVDKYNGDGKAIKQFIKTLI